VTNQDGQFAEMSGGGLPYWEPDVVPMLADFECSSCLQIGAHGPGCPNDWTENMMDDLLGALEHRPPEELCKIEGCTEPWVSQRGPYGRLCAAHAGEARMTRASSNNGHRPSEELDADGEGQLAPFGAALATLEQFNDDHEIVARARTIVALEAELTALRGRIEEEVAALRELLADGFGE
jgi:hypothetical protein